MVRAVLITIIKRGIMNNKIDIGKSLSHGWSGFKNNAGTAILVVLIYLLLDIVISYVPFLDIIYALFIAPVITGGLYIFSLKAARNEETSTGNLFEGFRRFPAYLGLFWMYIAIFVLIVIPFMVLLYLESANPGYPLDTAITVAAVVTLLVFIYAMIRLSMGYFLVIDGLNVTDAIKKSVAITKGNEIQILVLVVIYVALVFLGILALVAGVLVALPFTTIAFSAAYMQLMNYDKSELPHMIGE